MCNLNKFTVQPDLFFVLAFSLFLLPLQWVLGWFLAAAIHEISHILAIHLMGIRILSMKLTSSGAVIITDSMKLRQELICALSGPAGGLFALLLIRLAPHFALCAGIQSIYNLLPIYPLDGGRALNCLFQIVYEEKTAEQISLSLNMIVIAVSVVFGLYLFYCCKLGVITALFPLLCVITAVCKNTLQTGKNDSTIRLYPSNTERKTDK